MRNIDRVKVARVKLALGRSLTTMREHLEMVFSGGVRFWGTAAQIELNCSLGKQNNYRRINVLLSVDLGKNYLTCDERAWR